MWPKAYRDYKVDEPLKKVQYSSGNGIVGVEMNEPNGWGNTYHVYKKKKKGKIGTFLSLLFGKNEK